MLGKPVSNPPNPWASAEIEYLDETPRSTLEIYEDHTREILSKNSSPDIPFTYSVNPYRGCMHACAYCYARPGHEYLSFGAGTDFETKIIAKRKEGFKAAITISPLYNPPGVGSVPCTPQ